MLAYLEKALNVRRRELLPASLLFTYLFLVIGAYIMGQSAGDSLFLSAFPRYLPHAIMATAVAVGVFVSVHIRLSRRLPLEPLSVGLLLFFAVSFAVLWWATGLHSRWVYAINFVWVYAAGAMAPIVGWTLGNYVLTTREARRVFGFIGAGGILGATCAGLFTAAVSRRLGPDNLLLVMAFTLAAAAVTVKVLFSAAGGRIEEAQRLPVDSASPRSFRESARLIRQSRYLLLITALIAVGSATTTIIGYQFKIIAKDFFVNKEALTAFFGRFYGYMGLASFFLQMLLTGRLLRSVGVRVTLFVLPVVLLGGSIGVLLIPVLATAIVLKGSHNLLRYSLDKSSAELLYLPVPPDVKNGVKSFIDGFVWRTADGVAGLVLLEFATFLHFGPGRMSLVTSVFLLGWIAIAAGVRREYLNVLRHAIQRHVQARPSAALDSVTSEMLAIALDRGDEHQVLYGLSLYEEAREPRWQPLLRQLLQHPSATVRSRALRLLTEAGDRDVLPQVQSLLRDRSPEVRSETLHYLVLHTECDPVSLIRSGSDFPDYALSGAVVAYLARLRKPENFAAAQLILEQMIEQRGPGGIPARMEAARILGVIPPPSKLHKELARLLADDRPEVVNQALDSAGRLRLPGALSQVIALLGEARFVAAARAALVAYGDAAVPALQDALNNERLSMAVRRQIPDTLARIPSSQAAGVLALSLMQSDAGLRFDVVKALNKLRRDESWVIITQRGDFEAVLHAEITGFYRSFQILTAVDPKAGSSLDSAEDDSVLVRALREQMDQEFERIFRMLALVYPPRDIHNAFFGLKSGNPQIQANALEVLEHMLKPELYRRLVYALDSEMTLEQKLSFAEQLCRSSIRSRSDALRALLHGDDRWLRACALHAVGEWGELELYDDVRQMAGDDDDELLRETWQRVMARLDSVAAVQGGRMLSVLEKVDRLQKVPMFQGVRTESLGRVAAVAQELLYHPGDSLYSEDGAADAMYLILEGEVAMTRRGVPLNKLGPNDVAGVLGVLSGEAQPESAHVHKPTRVLKIDQQDFYDTMADDFQITRGILRGLVEVINAQARREAEAPLKAA